MLHQAASQFLAGGVDAVAQPMGRGNINDTYLVTPARGEAFVLQRINSQVFPNPLHIIHNWRVYTIHARQRLSEHLPTSRWVLPELMPTHSGGYFWRDPAGEIWRAVRRLAGASPVERIQSPEQAREVGLALGFFHFLVSDLHPRQLHDTLPGFHITPGYLRAYDQLLANPRRAVDTPEARYCVRAIAARRSWASVLQDAQQCGALALRVAHGDPKSDNIMMDERTGRAVGIIDLDTLKPGLLQYDIGDCLRSSCNPQGESPLDLDSIRFEVDVAREILAGYRMTAGRFLTEADYDYMYDAIRLMTFECGLRFFSDYLAGDVYFKVRHAEHNLVRAVVQFRLVESIEAQAGEIQKLIAAIRKP